jgi:uncharacterized protein (DUF488 family)
MRKLFTIGYSPHTPESFLEVLRFHGVDAVADVRSSPYSARQPEFNTEQIKRFLKAHDVEYVYLGDCVGARFEDPEVYVDGVADFERIAVHPVFREGLDRIRLGADQFTLALMCAEKDPLTCHRTILIARNLREELDIHHILADGSLESQAALEQRLLKAHSLDQVLLPGMIPDDHQLGQAYRLQGRKIAFRAETDEQSREFS